MYCICVSCVNAYRCAPIPNDEVFCRTTFKFSHYSSPVTNQLSMHIARISTLALNGSTSLGQECASFFAFYQCIGSYTPCNVTSMKIYSFCKDSCNTINTLALKCLEFASIDPEVLLYLVQFDCFDPQTYTSSLTLDYYESPGDEMCNALSMYLG